MLAAVSLRRFRFTRQDDATACPQSGRSHDASTAIGEAVAELVDHKDGWGRVWRFADDETPRSDPRWPRECACGYVFELGDEWQVFHDPLYRRVDGRDDRISLRNPPPGAMWFSEWILCDHEPKCATHLLAITPDTSHAWDIDGRASNCTMPADRTHRCWVRHGEPPRITVDKNGPTCAAGAGSIVAGAYHGFLIAGRFTDG